MTYKLPKTSGTSFSLSDEYTLTIEEFNIYDIPNNRITTANEEVTSDAVLLAFIDQRTQISASEEDAKLYIGIMPPQNASAAFGLYQYNDTELKVWRKYTASDGSEKLISTGYFIGTIAKNDAGEPVWDGEWWGDAPNVIPNGTTLAVFTGMRNGSV